MSAGAMRPIIREKKCQRTDFGLGCLKVRHPQAVLVGSFMGTCKLDASVHYARRTLPLKLTLVQDTATRALESASRCDQETWSLLVSFHVRDE